MIAEKIQEGTLNLSTVNLIAGFLKDENITDPKIKEKVIKEVEGKTARETEVILHKMSSDDTPRKVNVSLRENTVQELRNLQGERAHSYPDLSSLLDRMIVDIREVWAPMRAVRTTYSSGETRHVPIAVKQRLKQNAQCTNCGSKYALEIDHIRPFSKEGKTLEENLQILCRNCNQRKAFVDYGIRQFPTK